MAGKNNSIQNGLQAGAIVGAAISKIAGKKADPTQKTTGTLPVDKKADKEAKELAAGYRSLYKSGTLSMQAIRQNIDSLTPDLKARVLAECPEFRTPQGATSTTVKTTEVGYKKIKGAPKPTSGEMSAYHNRHENSGDASITGVDTNSARFKARVIAQNTARINIEDERTFHRGGGGLSEADFKKYWLENHPEEPYTPPAKDSYWNKIK